MKIRIGFVSNSSSSSFVIFGFAVDKDHFTREQLLGFFVDVEKEKAKCKADGGDWKDVVNYLYEYVLDCSNGVRILEDDGISDIPADKILIGIEPIPFDENGSEVSRCDFSEIIERVEKVRVKLGFSANMKAEVFSGNQAC